MKILKVIILFITLAMSAQTIHAEKSYNITEVYEVTTAEKGTKTIANNNSVSETKFILVPTKDFNEGRYIVKVQKIGNNLYQIKNTDFCVEARYCNEYTSSSEEVVIIIESKYGSKKGVIIFD